LKDFEWEIDEILGGSLKRFEGKDRDKLKNLVHEFEEKLKQILLRTFRGRLSETRATLKFFCIV
jgi:hypothetical protein